MKHKVGFVSHAAKDRMGAQFKFLKVEDASKHFTGVRCSHPTRHRRKEYGRDEESQNLFEAPKRRIWFQSASQARSWLANRSRLERLRISSNVLRARAD